MNTVLNLSPRELLFAAALLDATEFMGVSDAFFGMEDEEIQQEMATLQSSLEEKGYGEQDFDGGFILKDTVQEMVDVCANCEFFIVIDKNKVAQPQFRELYYGKGGHVVGITEHEGGYALTPISSLNHLIEKTLQDVVFLSSGPSTLQKTRITNTLLTEAKTQANGFDSSVGVKTLMKAGCDEVSATVILEGLLVKANYYAVIATVLEGDNEGVYSAMLIDTEKGMYRIALSDDDAGAIWFDPITVLQARAALEGAVRSVFQSRDGGFA